MKNRAQITRRWWFLASTGAVSALCVAREELLPRLRSERLSVTAPGLRLLSGKPLEHLRNGSALAFDFQLTLLAGPTRSMLDRALERFVVSYDVWEEKFAVEQMGSASRSASRLSASAAEKYCFDNVSLATRGLQPETDFWLRLEVHVEDPREKPPLMGNHGLNLNNLVEIFSRTSRASDSEWRREAGPFRLSWLGPRRPSAFD